MDGRMDGKRVVLMIFILSLESLTGVVNIDWIKLSKVDVVS